MKIKNFWNSHKGKLFLILLLILIIPTFYSLIRPGYFPMQDDLQAFRINQMNKCFDDGQFPCRWVPDAGYQYGYPLFNFYAPSVFYLGAILHSVGFQIIDSVKIIFILGFILAPFFMYLFLNSFLKNSWAALAGSVLYAFSPIRAQEVYVRGSISEFCALIFFPLLFWSSLQLIRFGKNKYLLYLSLSLGLLMLTHNLLSLLFLPILILWILFILSLEKKWHESGKVFLGLILGVSLAAFFLLPVFFEKQYVHSETLLGGYFDYRQHFVDLYQLFISNHFGYGSSVFGPGDDLNLSVGQLQWVTAVLALILAVLFYRKNRKLTAMSLFIAALLAPILFLMHQRSSFIWQFFPMLAYLQFPWRFLAFSSFLLPILAAIGIYLSGNIEFKKLNSAGVLTVLIIILVLSFYANFFQPRDWINLDDKTKFSGGSWNKQLTISIFDYLPIYASLPPNHQAPELPEVLDGKVTFINYRKGSNYQKGLVNVEQTATVRLPLFDFPGMAVYVDNNKVLHHHSDCRYEDFCLGLITFKIDTGQHLINAVLEDTLVRTIGNIISLFGGFVFILILIKNFGILQRIKWS